MVDYFALGIIIYKMAVAKHPFRSFLKIESELKKAITAINPEYPVEIDLDLVHVISRVSKYRSLKYMKTHAQKKNWIAG